MQNNSWCRARARIKDFASGDQHTLLDRTRIERRIQSIFAMQDTSVWNCQLTQLDRGRTESPARSIFAMQSIAV